MELSDRSGGNPLFLQELVHAARKAGSVEGLPDSIEGMMTAEVDRLAERRPAGHPLRLGLGRELRPTLLGSLWDDEDSSFDSSVWRRLSEVILDEGDGRYRFRHALMRDAVSRGSRSGVVANSMRVSAPRS